MPSAAFLKAAKKGSRRPVVLLSVEAPPPGLDAKEGFDAVSTREDWQASPVLTNLNVVDDPGSVFLKTDGPEPYASLTPDPGMVLADFDTPRTYFSATDWSGLVAQETKIYALDVWSGWTPPSHDRLSRVTLNFAPHLFDGYTATGNRPVVTAFFTFDIWGKFSDGSVLRLAVDQQVDASATLQSITLPELAVGSWQFAIHLTRKASIVSSAALGYVWAPNSVYDNKEGSSYLTLKSYAAEYVVNLATPKSYFWGGEWGRDTDPVQRTVVCDLWTGYTPASQSHTTEATLVLAPHLLDGEALGGSGNVCTTSFNFDVWGKKDGGAPQLMPTAQNLSIGGDARYQSVKLSGLARGSWQFALHVTGKVDQYFVDVFSRPGVAEVYTDNNDEGSWLELYSYTTNQQSNYLPTGYLQTRVLDLKIVPTEPPIIHADAQGGIVVFQGWGSGNASDWSALGTVRDGDALAPYRYYYFGATFSASPDGQSSATLKEIRVAVGNFLHFSTMKDVPVRGARPYLVEGSLNALTCSIGLMEFGKIGEISPRLFWTEEVSDLIATGYLKNKAVACRLGFPELSLEDYEDFFAGSWYDYSADHEQRQITVQTRDVWKQLKTRVPPERHWTDDNGQKVKGKVYTLEGNIIDVMLQVANEANVSERYLDRDGFAALKAAHFPDAQWYLRRQITSSQDADKLLGDLAIAAGVFLYPDNNGRLTAVHYDSAVAGEPAAVLDALRYPFKPVAGGQKDLYTRQAISYQLLPGKEGDSDSDYASLYLDVDNQAESQWGESHTKSWHDVWGIGYDPVTGRVEDGGAIKALAKRMHDWYATPKMSVQVSGLPPKYLGLKPGQVVAVNNLRLPAAAENWPGFVTGKKFLIMQRGINPNDLTLTLDLFEVGPTSYLPGELPSYQVFDRYPAVLNLRANECLVQRATGAVEHLVILQFERPTDYVFGSAEVWMRTNAGAWGFVTPAAFSAAESSWIEVPVITGNSYDFAVLTINSAGLKQSLELAPQASITTSGVSTIAYTPPAQDGSGGDTDLPGVVVLPPASDYPPVTGLQLAGQGLDTQFLGRDASFTWNRYSFLLQLGTAQGEAASPVDGSLKGYSVTIRNPNGTVRRSEVWGQVSGGAPGITGEGYLYSYEQNRNDGEGVAARDFTIEVVAVGVTGQSAPASLSVGNPAPPAVSSVVLIPFIRSFSLDITPLDLPDLSGYLVHASKTQGFTPSPATLLNRGPDTHLLLTVEPGSWYVRIAAYDVYGEDALNYSAEYTVDVAAGILPDDLYSTLRADFLVRDSIFFFGDKGLNPTPATKTRLYWTGGSILRGDQSFTLSGGSMANAQNSWLIATLAAGVATLSLAACGGGMPELESNQVIIAATSSGPNSAGNYLCYVRQANAQLLEGSMVRDLTVTNAKFGGYLQSDDYLPGSGGWHIGKDGAAEFHDVTVRGDVEATSIHAGSVNIVGTLMLQEDAVVSAVDLMPADFTVTSPGGTLLDHTVTVDELTVNRPHFFVYAAQSSAPSYLTVRVFDPAENVVKLFGGVFVAAPGSSSLYYCNGSGAFIPTQTGNYRIFAYVWSSASANISNANFYLDVAKR